jgi:hypothetical protein
MGLWGLNDDREYEGGKKESRSFVVHFIKMDVVVHRLNVALPQLGVAKIGVVRWGKTRIG